MRTYDLDIANSRHHYEVNGEMKKAVDKFPLWPNDMFHALAIIGEEYGEIVKAVLQFHYEPDKNVAMSHVEKEAIQTICMLHRFLNSIYAQGYVRPNCEQHNIDRQYTRNADWY